MLANDPVHGRQAETGPAASSLGRKEGLEDAPHGRSIHAASSVRHRDPDIAPGRKVAVREQEIGLRLDRVECDLDRAAAIHGVGGVCAEIHNHLLQLRCIAVNPCVGSPQRNSQAQCGRKRRAQELDRLCGGGLSDYGTMSSLAAAAEGENLVDNAARALPRLHDLLEMLPHRGAAGARFQCDLGVSKNGAENVVEFVRDPTRESADRFQLLCLMQARLPVPERSRVGLQPQEQVRDIDR